MRARSYPRFPVLLVDDDKHFLEGARLMLESAGITNLVVCDESKRAMDLIREQGVGVAIIDMMMPSPTGPELLKALSELLPELPVLIVTAVDEIDSAVSAVRAGAFDYMVKPLDGGRLVTSVQRAIELRGMHEETQALRRGFVSAELQHPEVFAEIVTADPAMLRLFQYIEAVSKTDKPVLITGETGVGKELIARALHKASGRSGELVELNVAGTDDVMLSDVLFGHKRGAFTGAEGQRGGLIEQAAGGTLFLDEIGDLATTSQVKLLRLLQDSKYYPVGSDVPKLSDARVIAATNLAPEVMQKNQKFRADLFYRLQAHHVRVPPLRQRKADLPLLFDFFLDRAAQALGKDKPTVPKELWPLLASYDWPGNVRELDAMVLEALSHHRGGVLSLQQFHEKMGRSEVPADEPAQKGLLGFGDRLPTLKQAEGLLVEEALRRAEGSQTLAARLLGVSRQALNNRLRRERDAD